MTHIRHAFSTDTYASRARRRQVPAPLGARLIDVTLERWGDHEREIVEHSGAVAIVAIDRAC